MLLTDKKNRNYAYVTLEDILASLDRTSDLNDSEKKDLKKLYHKEEFDGDKIRISKRSKAYKKYMDALHSDRGYENTAQQKYEEWQRHHSWFGL